MMHPAVEPTVRSYSPDIHGRKQKQTKVIFLGQLGGIYRGNYTTRSCVDAISADVAKGGHRWVRNEAYPDDPTQRAIREQADRLISYPNPQMTEHDLWKATSKDILIFADSFTEVVYDNVKVGEKVIGQTPGQFWPIASHTVFIIPDDETGILPEPPCAAYKQQEITGSIGPQFTTDEIIHISEGNLTGRLYGTPRLLSAILLIATQTQSMRFNLKMFTGQKYPKAMVGVGKMNDNEIDRLVAKAQEQAAENPHGVMFLAADVANLLRLIDSNRDMEFMELQKFVEKAIAAVFRVPRVKLGISEAGGAGIVVGRTQLETYWDNVEEIQREIAEQFNHFFFRKMNLKAWKLELISGRPEEDLEQAQIADIRVKNGTLTINEDRKNRGLEAVEWGDAPPVAQPALLSLGGSQDPHSSVITSYAATKAQAPGRMRDSALVDPESERIKERTRSRLAGSWMRAKARVLELFGEFDAITQKAEGEKIITAEDLAARIDEIFADWESEAIEITSEGTADTYASGRIGMKEDLEEPDIPDFTKEDTSRIQAIQEEFSTRPIRTFRGEQRTLIEAAIEEAYLEDIRDVFEIRERIEENFRQLTTEETWKLDRIVRTSIGNSQRESRASALRDSGVEEVRVITANDRRVRPKHKALHNKVVPLDDALRILNEPNCRCRIVKPAKRPKTVPSPDMLAAAIQENGENARTMARESLGVE